jgi:hypothetical protein
VLRQRRNDFSAEAGGCSYGIYQGWLARGYRASIEWRVFPRIFTVRSVTLQPHYYIGADTGVGTSHAGAISVVPGTTGASEWHSRFTATLRAGAVLLVALQCGVQLVSSACCHLSLPCGFASPCAFWPEKFH